MRKTFLIAMIAASFIMVSCGGSDSKKSTSEYIPASEEALKLLNSVELTKDGLVSMIKSKDTLTDVEYEAMYLAFSKVGIDQEYLLLEDNPVEKALDEIYNNHKMPSNEKELKLALLSNKSPQVRGNIVNILDLLGDDKKTNERVKEILKNETNPYVLKSWISGMRFKMDRPEFAELALSNVDNENSLVRQSCVEAIANSSSIGIKGTTEAIIKLMHDSVPYVRNLAYRNCGSLQDDALVPELEKVLNDQEQVDSHSDCLGSLIKLWYDWPKHKYTSKAAYDATLNYYKNAPRGTHTPSSNGFEGLKRIKKENPDFIKWSEKATYFKPTEWVTVLIDIAKDAKAKTYTREQAVEVIDILGTDGDLKKLKTDISNNADDNNKESVIKKIDEKL